MSTFGHSIERPVPCAWAAFSYACETYEVPCQAELYASLLPTKGFHMSRLAQMSRRLLEVGAGHVARRHKAKELDLA